MIQTLSRWVQSESDIHCAMRPPTISMCYPVRHSGPIISKVLTTKISFLQLSEWVINLSSLSNSRKTKPISSFVFFSTSEQWTKTASLCFDRNSLRFVGELTIEPKSDCQKFLWRHRFIKHWFWDTWALRSTQPWTQSENNFSVDLRWILLNQKYWSRIPL